MKRNTVKYLTEGQSREAVAKFNQHDLLPPHSLSDPIKKHPSPYSPSDPLALELLVSIFRTSWLLHSNQETMLRKHNLSNQAWRTLVILFFNRDRTMPLHRISEHLAVTRPHVTGIIDIMEQEGLVERIADPNDRRVTLAHLTEQGVARMIEVGPQYNVLLANLFSPFSEEEKELLLALLYRLRCHLANDDSADPVSEDETSG